MFLSIHALGHGTYSTALPPKHSYQNVYFYGECTLDNIRAVETEISDGVLQNLNTQQEWDAYTLFLANFENTLDASQFILNMPITHLKLKRRKTNEFVYDTIYEIEYTQPDGSYIDLMPSSGVEYEYALYPLNNGIEGRAVITTGMVEFDGWILTDGTNTYIFDLEVQADEVRTLLDYKKYDNYTGYPVINFGNRQYDEGGLSTIPYSFNGNDFVFDINTLDQIKNFINNKQPKTLKNSKGRSWKVVTYDYTEKYLEEYVDIPVVISFKWTQIGEGE